MNQPATQPITERATRKIYIALVAGVLVILAALYALGGAVTVPEDGYIWNIGSFVSFAPLIPIGVVVYLLRVRIPAIGVDEDRNAWWAANAQRVIVLWVVAGGTVTLGGVIWFLTREGVTVGYLVGLAMLYEFRPSSWPTPARVVPPPTPSSS